MGRIFLVNLKVSFIFVAVKIGFNISIGQIAFVSHFLFFVESGASWNLSDTGASMGCIYKLEEGRLLQKVSNKFQLKLQGAAMVLQAGPHKKE